MLHLAILALIDINKAENRFGRVPSLTKRVHIELPDRICDSALVIHTHLTRKLSGERFENRLRSLVDSATSELVIYSRVG